jgi:hypothetical protein
VDRGVREEISGGNQVTLNEPGIAVMRSEIPSDATPFFDAFVAMAEANDYSVNKSVRKTHRITQKPDDGRSIYMRAFMTPLGQVGFHVRIYLKGTYGVLMK